MSLVWLGILLVFVPLALASVALVAMFQFVKSRYLGTLLRIFEEKPLFIIPRGERAEGAEDVEISAIDGSTIRGCYLRTEASERKGVILFGLEFGSNRWSCRPYCEELLKTGYDVFAFEPRSQGESDKVAGYDPLQWLTRYELDDTLTAVEYLRQRPDADANGIGFFGISKGGSAGLMAASKHGYIRCVVTDGAFATVGTMIPFMRKFATIYSNNKRMQNLLPDYFYRVFAQSGVASVARKRHVEYMHLEPIMKRLKRPLMMIHGEKDSYIKVAMAEDLFRRAAQPKRFWIVPGARHNQALHLAGQEYHDTVRGFFDYHLAGIEPGTKPISVDVADVAKV